MIWHSEIPSNDRWEGRDKTVTLDLQSHDLVRAASHYNVITDLWDMLIYYESQ